MPDKSSPSPHRHKTITKRSYKHFNYENFISDILHSSILQSLVSYRNVNTAWDLFKNEFLKISDFPAPICTIRVKNMPNSWIFDDIIKLIYKRNYFHKILFDLRMNIYGKSIGFFEIK